MSYRSILVGVSLLTLSLLAACGDKSADEDRDGGGGADSCTLRHHEECAEDTTYWVDSCGERGDVAELCECGCNRELSACESACACTPDCDTKDCGDDGCGDSCGECEDGTTCNAAGVCVGEQTPDQLTIEGCSVPYVLDASKVGDMLYMTTHFGDLVQQYCVAGTVGGQDITAFPEKMYYGQHDGVSVVSFVQVSMSDALAPTWTVMLDFNPDNDFTAGSVWKPMPTDETSEVSVALLKHEGTSICLEAIGGSGAVNVVKAENCTLIEGGTFEIQGTVGMVDPQSLGDFCAGSSIPCCS